MVRELAAQLTRHCHSTTLCVLKLDRPRRIDQVIDYFGTPRTLGMLLVPGRIAGIGRGVTRRVDR